MLEFDTTVFHWINSHNAPWLDWLLWAASQPWSWAVVLTAAIVALCHGRPPAVWLWTLAGIGLCFLLADRISVLCFKDVFCRLRPCHALEGVRMFRTSCGGQYGFVSSHAANVFALALFLSLRRKRDRRPVASTRLTNHGFQVLLILWACLVGYSRPYLGKHYPGDVLCGALLGLLIGTAVFFIIQYLGQATVKRPSQKKQQQA